MNAKLKLTGVVNWQAKERRSDRYGGIMLLGEAAKDELVDVPCVSLESIKPLIGQQVEISAKVIEARESYHIGDLFHGFFPSKPEVGEVINLGTGTLVGTEIDSGYEQLVFRRNVRADEGTFWIDPKKLYRLHHQTVELTFIPFGGRQ